MAVAREETISYFVERYGLMLEENLDDYVGNFDKYKQWPKNAPLLAKKGGFCTTWER
jgi:hypothetical protein